MTIALLQSGRPVGVVLTSYECAKTLSGKIGGIVSSIEEQVGTEYLDIDEMVARITKAKAKAKVKKKVKKKAKAKVKKKAKAGK